MAEEYAQRRSRRVPLLSELGGTGLFQFGGVVSEEWLRRLDGTLGQRVYREMRDNDPTVGSILFAIEMLLRGVPWRVESYSDDPIHVERSEFVESLVDDTSHTWSDFVAEALSMLPFGYAPFEIVYKRRVGPEETDPTSRSRYRDGLIGWRKLAIRAQDTVDRWKFGEDGGLEGLYQSLPDGRAAFVPIEKLLVFKTTSHKSNPEGRSILRNAFLPWFRKRRIEECEAIGVERDLAGIPVVRVPGAWFNDDKYASKIEAARKLGETIKNDEQASIVIPSMFDDQGNRVFDFELLSTNTRRLIDTDKVVARYDRQIAQTALADFLLLGHEKVGSFSLSSDKTELFSLALQAWLQELADVLNRHALPRLYALNGWDPSEAARFCPGDLEKPEVQQFADAMLKLTTAGWLTPGSRDDEIVVRERLGMPEPSEELEAEHARPEPLSEVPPPDAGPPVPPLEKRFNPSQPRNQSGEWSSGGGGSAGSSAGGGGSVDFDSFDEGSWVKGAKTFDQTLSDRGQRIAVGQYTGSGYSHMNGALRSGKKPPKEVGQAIDRLDAGIAAAGSFGKNAPVLHRGVQGKHASALRKQLKVGSTIEDKGFSSWSVKKANASRFLSNEGGRGKGILFRMKLPGKEPGLFVDHAEAEMILGRGKKYKVSSINKGGKNAPDVYTLELTG